MGSRRFVLSRSSLNAALHSCGHCPSFVLCWHHAGEACAEQRLAEQGDSWQAGVAQQLKCAAPQSCLVLAALATLQGDAPSSEGLPGVAETGLHCSIYVSPANECTKEAVVHVAGFDGMYNLCALRMGARSEQVSPGRCCNIFWLMTCMLDVAALHEGVVRVAFPHVRWPLDSRNTRKQKLHTAGAHNIMLRPQQPRQRHPQPKAPCTVTHSRPWVPSALQRFSTEQCLRATAQHELTQSASKLCCMPSIGLGPHLGVLRMLSLASKTPNFGRTFYCSRVLQRRWTPTGSQAAGS